VYSKELQRARTKTNKTSVQLIVSTIWRRARDDIKSLLRRIFGSNSRLNVIVKVKV
jgi:hypothetical protein